jgi:hypothetical protein
VNSYFTRHTERLLVRREHLLRLWEENRIAIHYPDYRGKLRRMDNESRDPEDYTGTAKSAVRCLKELGDLGG